MKHFIYFIIVFLVLSFPLYAIDDNGSYQYHNYEWGMNKDQVKKLIKNNGYEYNKRNGDNVVFEYKDKILDNKAKISLAVGKETNKLNQIGLQFKQFDGNVENIKNIIYDKYGKPCTVMEKENVDNIKDKKKYIWVSENKKYMIKMDYHIYSKISDGLIINYIHLNYKNNKRYYYDIMEEINRF